MKATKSVPLSVPSPQLLRPLATGPVQSWVRFWFAPVDPVGLHVVRLLAGLLFLGWLLPYAGHLNSLFGLEGWFDRRAYTDAVRLEGGPPAPISWSLLYVCGTNATLLAVVYWMSIGILVLFTLGFWTRLTGVLTWIVVGSFTANPVLGCDGDVMLLIISFYLMIGYLLPEVGDKHASLLTRLFGSTRPVLLGGAGMDSKGVKKASIGANLAMRLLQVHLALVLVSSGLHKLQFGDWWAGVAFWYPLHPAFETTLDAAKKNRSWAESYLFFLSLAVYLTLAWEILFPLFAWRSRWRPLVLGGGLLGWLGTAFLYQIPVFGPALFVACLSFVSPAGWRRLHGFFTQRFGSVRRAEEDKVGHTEESSLVTVEQR